MIGDRLVGPLAGPLLTALAISIAANVALGWALRSSWGHTGALEATLETQKGETRIAAEANDKLQVEIQRLIGDKQALIDQYAADRAQVGQELAERDRKIRAAYTKIAEERRQRDELTKTPTCKAFRDSVFADRCPDLARSLRGRTGDTSSRLRADLHP